MSVSQFPNATVAEAEELFLLVGQLHKNIDPALLPDVELIISAYTCAMVEQLVTMQKLTLYPPLDPVLLRKIHDSLNSCR